MPTGFSWAELDVDGARVVDVNHAQLPPSGEFVLYWCMVNHRAEQNHALDAAIALGNHLGLPVVCYHALRPDYPHASDRLHAFAIEGMIDLRLGLKRRGVPYWPELPRKPSEHKKRIAQLGKRASAIVTDAFPTYVVPGHLRGASRALRNPLFAVDASCVVPMQRIPEPQIGARTLRPKVHKLWPQYLRPLPERKPKHAARAGKLDPGFQPADPEEAREKLGSFAIDHAVPPVRTRRGGRKAALARLGAFVSGALEQYEEGRNEPSEALSSGLSPYLHWGNLFAGEAALAAREALGEGHPSVQSFLEELLVRRELGFNYCLHTPPEKQLDFASLPAWARRTLDDHRGDTRDALYTLEELEAGRTYDGIWNASQRQLLEEGRIHNYLRMLWGKKILEWSPSPEEALKRISAINDRWALDGRDPASVANFMWVLGLHDRPFQERPVIGKVRPMSSFRTEKKFDLTGYLERYGEKGRD
ncbi:MAG TPA: deoxyribodipyrimidine photo-lyase [Myxococcaceae bacterium]|nr:deoxyribodipyrimidine photo-lyase [Myxococcaceae bacterium]